MKYQITNQLSHNLRLDFELISHCVLSKSPISQQTFTHESSLVSLVQPAMLFWKQGFRFLIIGCLVHRVVCSLLKNYT